VSNPYKVRRLHLLRTAYERTSGQQPIALDGEAARAAGYVTDYGARYYEVFNLDVDQLVKDGAIVPAIDHRGYEISQGTLYWITEPEGMEMLREAETSPRPQ